MMGHRCRLQRLDLSGVGAGLRNLRQGGGEGRGARGGYQTFAEGGRERVVVCLVDLPVGAGAGFEIGLGVGEGHLV